MSKRRPQPRPQANFEEFAGTDEAGKTVRQLLKRVNSSQSSHSDARGQAHEQRKVLLEYRSELVARLVELNEKLATVKRFMSQEHDRIRDEYAGGSRANAKAAWLARREVLNQERMPLIEAVRKTKGEIEKTNERLGKQKRQPSTNQETDISEIVRVAIRDEFGDLVDLKKLMHSFLGQQRGLEKVASRIQSSEDKQRRIADSPHAMLWLAHEVFISVRSRHGGDLFTKEEENVFSLIGIYLQLFGKGGLPT